MSVDSETGATLLPTGVDDQAVADLTDGEVPSREQFRPRELPR